MPVPALAPSARCSRSAPVLFGSTGTTSVRHLRRVGQWTTSCSAAVPVCSFIPWPEYERLRGQAMPKTSPGSDWARNLLRQSEGQRFGPWGRTDLKLPWHGESQRAWIWPQQTMHILGLWGLSISMMRIASRGGQSFWCRHIVRVDVAADGT